MVTEMINQSPMGGINPELTYVGNYGSTLPTINDIEIGKTYAVTYANEQGGIATVSGADVLLSQCSGGYNYYGTSVFDVIMIIKATSNSISFSGITGVAFCPIVVKLD